MKLTVLIADDHDLFRNGLKALVEAHPRLELVAEARSGAETLAAIQEQPIDVLILDHAMPDIEGLDIINRLADHPTLRIVLLTGIRSPSIIAQATKSSARAVVSKNDDPQIIANALDEVIVGRTFYSPEVMELAAKASLADQLTPRELQLLRLIARGERNKNIAQTLQLSVKTVDTHRTNLMRKLDCHSATQLVEFALRMGLISDESFPR